MRVVLTGAAGFLGWHTRLRLHAQGEHTVVPIIRASWETLSEAIEGASALIHIAGVNRADNEAEVRQANVALAEDVATALAGRPGIRVVYSNSTQAGNGTPYGIGKDEAAQVLSCAVQSVGGTFVDVRLPNIFGEYGRPRYNSFVATFVSACISGDSPTIQDNLVPLLHVQDAAQTLIDALTTAETRTDPQAEMRGVQEVWDLLIEFARSYTQGEFPNLSTKFRVDLFNAYRAALFPMHYPLVLTPHTDLRGTFVETVRSRGGEGQSSISTTAPGITRGEHYHLTKVERFAVLQGRATIALRKMFTDRVIEFQVSGEYPTAIDMPTGWAHNITNTGTDTLLTQFWSHEVYRAEAPDTFPESVRPRPTQEIAP